LLLDGWQPANSFSLCACSILAALWPTLFAAATSSTSASSSFPTRDIFITTRSKAERAPVPSISAAAPCDVTRMTPQWCLYRLVRPTHGQTPASLPSFLFACLSACVRACLDSAPVVVWRRVENITTTCFNHSALRRSLPLSLLQTRATTKMPTPTPLRCHRLHQIWHVPSPTPPPLPQPSPPRIQKHNNHNCNAHSHSHSRSRSRNTLTTTTA